MSAFHHRRNGTAWGNSRGPGDIKSIYSGILDLLYISAQKFGFNKCFILTAATRLFSETKMTLRRGRNSVFSCEGLNKHTQMNLESQMHLVHFKDSTGKTLQTNFNLLCCHRHHGSFVTKQLLLCAGFQSEHVEICSVLIIAASVYVTCNLLTTPCHYVSVVLDLV